MDTVELKNAEAMLITSAIDAYMHNLDYKKVGNCYRLDRVASIMGTTELVTCPNSDGSGGGVCGSGRDAQRVTHYFTEKFNGIRNRIKAVTKPFYSLPEIEQSQAEISKLEKLIHELNVADNANDGAYSTPLSGSIRELDISLIGIFDGRSFEALRSLVIHNFKPTLLAYREGIIVLYSALKGEQQMMIEARLKIVGALLTARSICDQIVKSNCGIGSAFNVDIVEKALKIAQVAIETYSAKSPIEILNAAKSALEVAKPIYDTLGATHVVAGAPFASKAGFTDPISVIKELERAAAEINRACSIFETTGGATMRRAFLLMDDVASRYKYDLNISPLSSKDVLAGKRSGDLRISDYVKANTIAMSTLPEVGDTTKALANSLLDVQCARALIRDASFALGPSGPKKDFEELQMLLYRLMTDFSVEVLDYAHNLQYTIDALRATDQASAAALRNIDRSVLEHRQHSQKSPWRSS